MNTRTADPPPVAAEVSPKRRQMLEAARELFMAQGYEKVSMDSVARAAQVSKATLYAHFAGKDALFASIVGDACFARTLNDEAYGDPHDDIRTDLETLGERMLRFLLDERTQAIYRVAVAEARRFPEMGRAFFDNGPGAFVRHFSAWLARQSDAGRLSVPVPQVAAEQFGALVRSGLFMTCTLGLGPPPTDANITATVKAAVDTFLKAYGMKAYGPSPAG
jgi:TetR/AcrR family transcriptional repressor of mexJK operon